LHAQPLSIKDGLNHVNGVKLITEVRHYSHQVSRYSIFIEVSNSKLRCYSISDLSFLPLDGLYSILNKNEYKLMQILHLKMPF